MFFFKSWDFLEYMFFSDVSVKSSCTVHDAFIIIIIIIIIFAGPVRLVALHTIFTIFPVFQK